MQNNTHRNSKRRNYLGLLTGPEIQGRSKAFKLKDGIMKIFLTDYNSYNNGTQFKFGHWVDLSDFSTASNLMEYIKEHFEEAYKESPLSGPREEIMITDYEGFPAALYSESMNEEDFEKVYQYRDKLTHYGIDPDEELTPADWETLYNEWAMENDGDTVHENDEDFFSTYFSNPLDAVRAAHFGQWSFGDDYVTFDGYGNLKSYRSIEAFLKDNLDEGTVIEWLLN